MPALPPLIFNLLDAQENLASDFHVRRVDLRAEAGWKLDYGRDESQWTAVQVADVNRVVDAAVRWVYWPHTVKGQSAHEWSWLKPVGSLATVAGTHEYLLPAYFGGLIGDMTYLSSFLYGPVRHVPETYIRKLRETQSANGAPHYAALRLVSASGVSTQRWKLLLFPTPDAVYTLQYQYQVLASALKESNPYVLGDASMAEIYLAAVRAACEQIILEGGETREFDIFTGLLGTAILRDEASRAPQNYGFMTTGSSSLDRHTYPVHDRYPVPVVYTPGV